MNIAIALSPENNVLASATYLRSKIYASRDFSKCLNLAGTGKGAPRCLSPSWMERTCSS